MKHPMQSVDIDEKICSMTSNVDWQSLSQAEAADFGLAVGAYRDARTVYDLKRTATGTAAGTVLSLSVLAGVAILVNASAYLVMTMMVASQVGRLTVLWWRARRAKEDVLTTETEACECAEALAETHAYATR